MTRRSPGETPPACIIKAPRAAAGLGEGCHAQSSWLCDTTSSRIHVNNLSQPEPAAIDHQRRFSGPPFSLSGFVGGRVGWGSWLNNRNHRSAGIASVDDFIPRRFGSLHRDLADRARSWWFKFGRVSWHDNLQRRKPRSGMRRRAGPLEVGLTPRCVLPATQPGHLSRVFKGNCKLFHRNFSGMADLINFMAGNHKTLLLQIDARLLFMRSN